MTDKLSNWPGVDVSDPRITPKTDGDTFGWDVALNDGQIAKVRFVGDFPYPWEIVDGPARLRLHGYATAGDAVAKAQEG